MNIPDILRLNTEITKAEMQESARLSAGRKLVEEVEKRTGAPRPPKIRGFNIKHFIVIFLFPFLLCCVVSSLSLNCYFIQRRVFYVLATGGCGANFGATR